MTRKIIMLEGQPVSVNKLYRGRRFLTKEGERIKFAYAAQAKAQYLGKPREDEIIVDMHVFFPSKNRADLDNAMKATLDSLTGVLWKDDRQIRELHVYKEQDKRRPRIELTVL